MKVAGGKVKRWQGEVKFGFHTFPLGSLSFFIWQAMHKKIATEYKVREIAGIIPSCRGLCMSSDEDVDHIFLHCPFAVSFLGENFLQLWTSFWYQSKLTNFLSLGYSYSRNGLVFENKQSLSIATLSFADAEYHESWHLDELNWVTWKLTN